MVEGHGELMTLEMSHEDIHQTLCANMGEGGGDLEPMSPSADDVFVNLDAFDILADLSDDLEQSHHNGGLMGAVTEKTTIVDINPEWAYSEVGAIREIFTHSHHQMSTITQHEVPLLNYCGYKGHGGINCIQISFN